MIQPEEPRMTRPTIRSLSRIGFAFGLVLAAGVAALAQDPGGHVVVLRPAAALPARAPS
jgi:hypothetical protein